MSLFSKSHLIALVVSLSSTTVGMGSGSHYLDVNRRAYESEGREEAVALLKQLGLQMKEMQLQINSLKAAQNSLTAESMIRNVVSKMRRIEMQIDYMDKRMHDIPSGADIQSIYHQQEELKSRLEDLGRSPIAHNMVALQSSLERMQKQIFFLYKQYKEGSKAKNISPTSNPSSVNLERMKTDIDQIKVALEKQHKALNILYNKLKEKEANAANGQTSPNILQLQQEFSNLKAQVNDLPINKIRKQIVILYKYLKESKALENELQTKVDTSIQAAMNKHKKIMVLAGKRYQELSTQLDSKAKEIEDFFKQINANMLQLNRRFEEVKLDKNQDQYAKMRQQIGYLYKQYKTLSATINAPEQDKYLDKISLLEKQTSFLYKKLTASIRLREADLKQIEQQVQLQLQSQLESQFQKNQSIEASYEAAQKTIASLEGKILSLESQIKSKASDLSYVEFQEEMKKRDEEISKLKRRIVYLYQNSQNITEGEAFEKFKLEMDAKLIDYANRLEKNKKVIDHLLDKITKLESNVSNRSRPLLDDTFDDLESGSELSSS